jgi:outer membrane receptor for ferrienterochelin and colicin
MLIAGSALAQVPTGIVTGNVSHEQNPLPGVTVVARSDALQGEISVITGENGSYMLRFLPPGQYTISFILHSFRTLEQPVKVLAAQTKTIDAIMYLEATSEEIVVTGVSETVSSGSQKAATVEQELLDKLPVARTLTSAVLLAPNVTSTGPGDNIVISGSQSYESLYLINGVVVNENLRGQSLPLFIEDAIQETTTMTSGISSEYGRFAGGVVNMLTKSGGNRFSGSLRLNLTNDDWVAKTPETTEREDKINRIWEGTLGGYVVKDRLWFFAAMRDSSLSNLGQLGISNTPYPTTDEQTRMEGKLTFSITDSHRFVGSYIEIDRTRTNANYYTPIEMDSLFDREDPQTLFAFNYNGVITPELFMQVQYSKRDFTIAKGAGSPYRGDLIRGTPMMDYQNSWTWNTPWFCSVCGDEERNNEDYLIKGSWFLSTDSTGTHDLAFGWDEYHDKMWQDNLQAASDWIVWVPEVIIEGGETYPVVNPYPYAWNYMMWWPLIEGTRGTDFEVTSFFVNDTWRYNEKLTFNIGVRYDQNSGVNSGGDKIAKDSRISPRLGMTYDLFGDGEWLINASYGHYVTALAGTNNVANGSTYAGSPALFGYLYGGDPINVDGPQYNTAETLQMLFDWFYDSYGGPANTALQVFQRVPGVTRGIAGGNIKSPYGEEYAIGVTKRLGSRGLVRLDYQHRSYKDLYETRIDIGTGTIDYNVFDGLTGTADYALIQNSDFLTREYDGLSAQIEYRAFDSLSIGGSYTWSHAKGNFNGETSGAGPVTSTNNPSYYPEYTDMSWANPEGDLLIDQRHKLRTWAVWDVISTHRHNLSASILLNYWSGTAYSAVGAVDTRPYVDNPGYLIPPSNVTYFFSERGAYTTPDIYRTDLALNYGFFFNIGATELEIFIQPEILNVLNNDDAVNVNNAVYDATTSFGETFNPFTDQPVEDTHWTKGSSFGEPQVEGDYQIPRTFRFSLGIRF